MFFHESPNFPLIIGWQVCFRGVNSPFSYLLKKNKPVSGEQGWHSDESTRLPPMSTRRWRHMWVEFVVGSLPCSKRFFSGYSSFPLSSKTNISKFQLDQESGRWRTTMWMYYLQIVIYLFIYLFYSFHMSGGSYKDLWRVPGLTNPSFHVYLGGFSFVEMEMENGECSC